MNIKIQAAVKNNFEIVDERSRFLTSFQNKHGTFELNRGETDRKRRNSTLFDDATTGKKISKV